MDITSSPGRSLPLSSNAPTKRVPKRHGRGSENVNVMAPHIAALFSLLIKKAHIPSRSWKEAKPTPVYKKGSVESRKLQNDRS